MSDPGICQSQLSDKESAEYEWSQYGVIFYYVCRVGCLFFIYYQFPLCISFNEWEEHTCWFKTCPVSSCGSVYVCDLILHTHSSSCFTLSPSWSLAPSRRHTRTLPPGGCCPRKGDVRREDWPRDVRIAMLGFSAPVSKEHSVVVWREECLCVVGVGLPCQHFKLRWCTYWCVYL